ncbi:HTH-type transcriptional activator IlvY [Pseudonocardia sp. KRD291]|uniref:HTH-type transcriptional activator IlvY n=1 Tax=Pseudonocardia sp. KRD291 TaxID=2792007 RepID=UPI001C4A3396|nr:HTH-type transcriptional activator IlvY [Pseudonocardia sp. KRD291]MBW0101608.1 HTH-type transcriptional activator IlvY [Pseudonocardia sp. KRD291]
MRDERRDLELFLDLCRTLSFGRTSLDRHVSPSTLTRTIQRLEADVGATLFDRDPRGVSLTAEGQRFREYARASARLWRDYRDAALDPVELSGTLSVFATVTACQSLLPDLLAPLLATHPGIGLDLRTGDAAAALARLAEGEVDAAVAGVPPRLPDGLLSRTVATTDLVLVTAADRALGPEDGPYVLPHRGLVRDAAERWLRRRGIRTPRIAAEPDGHEGLLTLVALGCGTGIVPRLVLDTSAVRDRLAVVPAEPPPERFAIGLCVRRGDLRRPLVAALWAAAGDRSARSETDGG